MKAAALFALGCLLSLPLAAKDKPLAPLPEALTSAKTVLLHGDQRAMDNAFAELKQWGRFDIVSDKNKADLVFEFAFTAQPDARLTLYKESLVIYGAKSGEVLYQDACEIEPSGIFTVLPKKSMAKAMIKGLRKRLGP